MSKARTDLRFELPASHEARPGVLDLLSGTVAAPARPSPELVDAWAKEAANGSPDAQYQLALALTQAGSLSADNRAAVKWLKKAVLKDHAASQHLLGVLIARGQGVRADPEKAVELFRAAAIMGNADAQFDLAKSLSWGFGCEVNEREALTWYRLAGAQGHLESSLAVGQAYARGWAAKWISARQ